MSLPEGYKCSCGHYNEFHLWVYAHWDIAIEGKCQGCGVKSLIRRGKVIYHGKEQDGCNGKTEGKGKGDRKVSPRTAKSAGKGDQGQGVA